MYILGLKLKLPSIKELTYVLIIALLVYLCARGFLILNLIKPVTTYEVTIVTFIVMLAEFIGLDTKIHYKKALAATLIISFLGILIVDNIYYSIPGNKPKVETSEPTATILNGSVQDVKNETADNISEPGLQLKLSETVTLPAESTMNEQFINRMNPDNTGTEHTLYRYR